MNYGTSYSPRQEKKRYVGNPFAPPSAPVLDTAGKHRPRSVNAMLQIIEYDRRRRFLSGQRFYLTIADYRVIGWSDDGRSWTPEMPADQVASLENAWGAFLAPNLHDIVQAEVKAPRGATKTITGRIIGVRTTRDMESIEVRVGEFVRGGGITHDETRKHWLPLAKVEITHRYVVKDAPTGATGVWEKLENSA